MSEQDKGSSQGCGQPRVSALLGADCSCYRCTLERCMASPEPGTFGVDMRMARMFLCPICGNKRCPKAADHRHECGGSNEPGQPGSLYELKPETSSPVAADQAQFEGWIADRYVEKFAQIANCSEAPAATEGWIMSFDEVEDLHSRISGVIRANERYTIDEADRWDRLKAARASLAQWLEAQRPDLKYAGGSWAAAPHPESQGHGGAA